MDISRFTPGAYRLTVDVAHPHPDRRYKYDWRKNTVVFKAGTEFFIKERGLANIKYLSLVLKKNRWEHQDIPLHFADDKSIPEGRLVHRLLCCLERVSDATEVETREKRRERICLALVVILKRALARGYFDDKPDDLPEERAEKVYAREHIDNYVREFIS